jgi:hypothetical protein
LCDAATAYKVDTDAIAAKVKQVSAAKDKAKKTAQPKKRIAKSAAQIGSLRILEATLRSAPSFLLKMAKREPRFSFL